MKKFTFSSRYWPALLLLVSMSSISHVTNAASFDSNISITGGTSFDNRFSSGNTTGDMSKIEGGVSTSTLLAGSVATGSDPLNGSLTDIGDGFSFEGSGSETTTGNEFSLGIDNTITISNTSAASVYQVVLELLFSNTVAASGDDSYADSEFSLKQDSLEIFFTDLVSDTLYGNQIGGSPTGDFGGQLSESGAFLITLLLNPSDSTLLESSWTVEGGTYVDGGSASFDGAFGFSVKSVTEQSASVPAPETLALLSIGLLGLGLSRPKQLAAA